MSDAAVPPQWLNRARSEASQVLLVLAVPLVVFGWAMALSAGPFMFIPGWVIAGLGVLIWPTYRRTVFALGLFTWMLYFLGVAVLLGMALAHAWERWTSRLSPPRLGAPGEALTWALPHLGAALLAVAAAFAVASWIGALIDGQGDLSWWADLSREAWWPDPLFTGWWLGGLGMLLWPTYRRATFMLGLVTAPMFYVGFAVLLGLAVDAARQRRAPAASVAGRAR